jgi:hypothetical protein
MQSESAATAHFVPPDAAAQSCIYAWDNAAVRAALAGLDVPEAVLARLDGRSLLAGLPG